MNWLGLLMLATTFGRSPRQPANGPRRSRPRLRWPVPPSAITRVGQTVMDDRNGQGRPHKGLDIFVPAGTKVLAPTAGRIVRVIDGRGSKDDHRRRAGLWVDLEGKDGWLYRFLHLGEATVSEGERVKAGDQVGRIAEGNTSGLGESGPHLHFEVRRDPKRAYGEPVDPLRRLPSLRA